MLESELETSDTTAKDRDPRPTVPEITSEPHNHIKCI